MRVWVRVFYAGAAVALLAPGPVESKFSANSPNVLQRLEARYAGARTLRVEFLERYTENGRFVRAEAGVAYFLKPGKMRWDYESPEKNTFLVDGKFVWFYSPADRTATRMPAKQSEDWRTPLALLTLHMKLSRLCVGIEEEKNVTPAQAGDSVFRCELKGEESAKRASKHSRRTGSGMRGQAESGPHNAQAGGEGAAKGVLLEVTEEGELRRIVVREDAGMELEFLFTGWEWDPPLDKNLFEFVPPKGVAIVEGLLPETPGLRQ